MGHKQHFTEAEIPNAPPPQGPPGFPFPTRARPAEIAQILTVRKITSLSFCFL